MEKLVKMIGLSNMGRNGDVSLSIFLCISAI